MTSFRFRLTISTHSFVWKLWASADWCGYLTFDPTSHDLEPPNMLCTSLHGDALSLKISAFYFHWFKNYESPQIDMVIWLFTPSHMTEGIFFNVIGAWYHENFKSLPILIEKLLAIEKTSRFWPLPAISWRQTVTCLAWLKPNWRKVKQYDFPDESHKNEKHGEAKYCNKTSIYYSCPIIIMAET